MNALGAPLSCNRRSIAAPEVACGSAGCLVSLLNRRTVASMISCMEGPKSLGTNTTAAEGARTLCGETSPGRTTGAAALASSAMLPL